MKIEAICIHHIPGSLDFDTPYGEPVAPPVDGMKGGIANGDLIEIKIVGGRIHLCVSGGDHFRTTLVSAVLNHLLGGQVPPAQQVGIGAAEQRLIALAVDDRLPSELDMAEQYGVSRDVIRRAKEELAGEGWLIVLHGRGTFVAQPDSDDSV